MGPEKTVWNIRCFAVGVIAFAILAGCEGQAELPEDVQKLCAEPQMLMSENVEALAALREHDADFRGCRTDADCVIARDMCGFLTAVSSDHEACFSQLSASAGAIVSCVYMIYDADAYSATCVDGACVANGPEPTVPAN